MSPSMTAAMAPVEDAPTGFQVVGRIPLTIMHDVPVLRLTNRDTNALAVAGAPHAQSLRFKPGTVDVNGQAPALVATPVDDVLDGRSDDHGRRIDRGGDSTRVRIPAADLDDVLGIVVDEIAGQDGVDVLLLASPGQGQLAIVHPDVLTFTVESQDWPADESH